MAQNVSINDFVLDLGQSEPRLVGGKCQDCGTHTFPRSPGCPKCAGSAIESARLGSRGTLWAWTVQGFPPKSPPYLGDNDPKTFKPFGVGYVELPEVIVEARLTESEPAKLAQGMPMKLVTEVLYTNENGEDVLTFAIAPDDGATTPVANSSQNTAGEHV